MSQCRWRKIDLPYIVRGGVVVSQEKIQTYAYGYLGQGTVVVSYCRSVAAENTDITCICMLRTRECRTFAEEHKYISL